MKTYKKILFILIWILPFFFPLLLQISGHGLKDLGISETYYGAFVVIWLVWFFFLDVILSKKRGENKPSFVVIFLDFLSMFANK